MFVTNEIIGTKSSNVFQAITRSNGLYSGVRVLNVDGLKNEINLEVLHFSSLFVYYQNWNYLVLDIPGEYLLKSDLLYTFSYYYTYLTGEVLKFNRFPGHVALYLGSKENFTTENDGQTIIESTPDFVRYSTLNGFTEDIAHLFLGARRYKGDISYEQRQQISDFAIKQLDKPWSLWGQDTQSKSFSCVGLTEAAYESAEPSLNIIPESFEFPFILPLYQFNCTKPIDKVEISYGQEIIINANGVSWNGEDEYVKELGEIEVVNMPLGASWTKSNGYWIFKWIPRQGDVNKDFDVTFVLTKKMEMGNTDKCTHKITFHVIPPNESQNYQNDFSGDLSDWTQLGGTWQIQNGRLIANYGIGCGSIGCPQADLILKDQFQPHGDWELSVDFTYAPDNSYNYGATGAAIILWESPSKKIRISVGHGGTEPWGFNPETIMPVSFCAWDGTWDNSRWNYINYTWRPREWHTMTIDKTGNVYTVYVDNDYLWRYTDNFMNGTGKIGLQTYGPKTYDNFIIRTKD